MDKTFCSVACRVRAHRQRQDALDIDFEDLSTPALAKTAYPLLPWQQPEPPAATAYEPVTTCGKPANEYLARYQAEEAAKATEQKRHNEETRCREVHEYYVEGIEPFLQYEGLRLPVKQLQQLLDLVVDAREDYKQHPHLAQTESAARQRLNDLWEAARVLRDAQAKATFFTGYKECYDLSKKWRKQLRDRLQA
ncbi:hypothetical protein GCM10022408_26890 [Hymenobacter fastidiosus]|uniref:DUF4254 domain-containing protein n=2 Tax=Hymenobacter fastidiosus TaxID=486264 RepID=A0ABP7SJU0_9BACT